MEMRSYTYCPGCGKFYDDNDCPHDGEGMFVHADDFVCEGNKFCDKCISDAKDVQFESEPDARIADILLGVVPVHIASRSDVIQAALKAEAKATGSLLHELGEILRPSEILC